MTYEMPDLSGCKDDVWITNYKRGHLQVYKDYILAPAINRLYILIWRIDSTLGMDGKFSLPLVDGKLPEIESFAVNEKEDSMVVLDFNKNAHVYQLSEDGEKMNFVAQKTFQLKHQSQNVTVLNSKLFFIGNIVYGIGSIEPSKQIAFAYDHSTNLLRVLANTTVITAMDVKSDSEIFVATVESKSNVEQKITQFNLDGKAMKEFHLKEMYPDRTVRDIKVDQNYVYVGYESYFDDDHTLLVIHREDKIERRKLRGTRSQSLILELTNEFIFVSNMGNVLQWKKE